MNNQTEINPNLGATIVNDEIGNATVVNQEVGKATAVNTEFVLPSSNMTEGTILGEGYTVLSPLNVLTGEADLYICKKDGREYIAKVYRRKNAVKSAVIEQLKTINSPYVAKLFDIGEYNGFPFEILPYYRNGSLQGKRFSFDELKSSIIPCINEALRVLHQNGIIHKDLKPSNIMLMDDGKSVAIIDFGISSVTENGATVLMTQTGMTPEYSAQETFRGLFLEESDYYSFGITLYELFCGYTPYKNMDSEKIARFTAVQKIPFPMDMPKELQNLISAVTYFDITNRHDKNNPNRRWTYEEVKNWCEGKKQIIPGEGTDNVQRGEFPAYTFMGTGYTDMASLVNALGANWDDGKKQLYRGQLSGFFKPINPEIAGFCLDAEEEANKTVGKENVIFWNLLYKLYPELNTFYWCGRTYESLPELGKKMLEKVTSGDTSDKKLWDDILSQKLLSSYLSLKKINDSSLTAAVSALETTHAIATKSGRDSLMNYYTMAYLLSGQKILYIDGKQIKDVSELAAYMKSLLDSSYEEFEDFCHKMIDYDDTLDVQLEAWLISLGKRKELDAWKRSLKN